MLPEWQVSVEARDGELEPLVTALAHLGARLQPSRPAVEVRVRAPDGESAVDYVRGCAQRARVRPVLIQVRAADDG